MSSTPPTHSVRRRARTQRPALFSRHLFRHSSRRRHSALETFPSSDQDQSSVPGDHSQSSSFLHRHRHRDSQYTQAPQPKPIYIYPGLLRIVRDKAIALDNQCPAVLYKCRECRRDGKAATTVVDEKPDVNGKDHSSPGASDDQIGERVQNQMNTKDEFEQDADKEASSPALKVKCPHQTSCSVCLEEFHSKDLVRKLPCNITHVFHSKCILDWFISHHRCPLCNEPVTNNPKHPRLSPRPNDDRRVSSPLSRTLVLQAESDGQGHIQLHRQRAISYSQPSTTRLPMHDQSARHSSSHSDQQDGNEVRQKLTQGEKRKRKQRGPRTYSYIVHDNVRMEMNPFIPV